LKRLFSRRRDAGTPPGDLTCRELVELVSDYLEGALSEDDRARFESHIEMCEGCTAYLDQMRKTLRMVGALEPEAVSPEAEQELLAAFRGWKSGGTA
jgi:predicted anti-sigma-YlaC factor YlaD